MKTRSSIATLVPYRSKQLDVPIVLNANETRNYLFPDGVPIDLPLARYPETNADSLRDDLAIRYDVTKEHVIIGNGSTDLLELAVKTFTDPGDVVLSFDPSFAMYRIYATIHGTEYQTVPAEDDKSQNIDRLIQAAEESNPALIFLCTPNNPTGVMNTRDDIARLLQATDALVIVDEAYMDFAFEQESVATWVDRYPNLIVARTFSKAYGLAAIRLGYLIANPTLINTLLKVKLPYSVNAISVAIGRAALQEEERVKTFLNEIVTERERMYQALVDLDFDVVPSFTNFLYVTTSLPLQDLLLKQGILIRSFGNDAYRITIGTKDQNDTIVSILKEVHHANQ
jgi:histidinol-phosphate aminotransferase